MPEYNNARMEELLIQYKPYLSHEVGRFITGCKGNPLLQPEDLYQEASMWFVRTCRESGLEFAVKYRRSLRHALFEACRRAYPVKIAYGAFCKKRDVQTCLYDDCMGTTACCDDVEAEVVLRSTLESLSPVQKRVLDLKLQGYTPKEISSIVGTNLANVYYALNRVKSAILS